MQEKPVEEVTLRNGVTLRTVEPLSYHRFWQRLADGGWEPETVEAIERLVPPGGVFVDIGGWIGPTALVGAAVGARVYSFEPDPNASSAFHRHLELNSELAKRITLFPEAVGVRSGRARISAQALGDSMASLARRRGQSAEIQVRAISEIAAQPWWREAVLVKIDIEGGEYELIPTMAPYLRDDMPALMLSTHVDYISDLVAEHGHFSRVSKALRLLPHPKLVWYLRFYRTWQIPEGSHWRPIGRLRAAMRLLRWANQEFLLQS